MMLDRTPVTILDALGGVCDGDGTQGGATAQREAA